VGGSNASSWWKNICDVKKGVVVQEVGCFKANMVCHVGNGENFSFWNDPCHYVLNLVVCFICLLTLI